MIVGKSQIIIRFFANERTTNFVVDPMYYTKLKMKCSVDQMH